MSYASSPSNINWDFKVCQLCDQPSHSAINCPFLYSKCMKPGCIGLRMILVSESNISKGKRFLKCQFPKCDGIEWLEDALKRSKCAKSVNCYHCNDTDHIGQNCPWDGVPCPVFGCNGSMHVLTAGTAENKGKKFLICKRCNFFEWLMDAIAKHEATTKQEVLIRKSSKGKCRATTSLGSTVEDVCHDFEKKIKMQTIPKCFHCEGTEHMAKSCPWKSTACTTLGCNGTAKLGTSSKTQTMGKKYIKCEICGAFAWLKDVLGDTSM